MMMGHENIRKSPSGGAQRSLDSTRLGRVNRGSGAALRIVQQHAIIVLKAKKKMGLCRHRREFPDQGP
jgi:hypothetical protein